MGKPVAGYFYTGNSTFVTKDLKILAAALDVKPLLFESSSRIKNLSSFIRQFYFLLTSSHRIELYICQFAGFHSLLPIFFGRIWKKPILIIAGGTESVSFPKLNYGNLRPTLLGGSTRYTLKNASIIAPVHESLIYQKYTYENPYQEKEQGMKALIPGFQTKYKVIWNGYDVNPNDLPKPKTLRIVTIVGGAEEKRRAILKGIDFLIEIAHKIPDVPITIIGATTVPFDLPKNMELIPFVESSKLEEHLESSMFYAQLSVSEGFPNALCEAMLCGCIPIVTSVGGMPEIVGNNGLILHTRSVEDVVNFIQSNTRELIDKSIHGRESILERYPLSKRKNELLNLVKDLLRK